MYKSRHNIAIGEFVEIVNSWMKQLPMVRPIDAWILESKLVTLISQSIHMVKEYYLTWYKNSIQHVPLSTGLFGLHHSESQETQETIISANLGVNIEN